MARMPFFRRTFRITRFKPDVPRDVAEEIDFYLDMRTEELIEEGMEPGEARTAARDAFGDRLGIEAQCRRIDEPYVRRRRAAEMFDSIVSDVYRALRDMRKRPAFTLTACLTLAICVALNTAVFSVVDSIILKPLPYPEPERVVALYNSYPNAGAPRSQNAVTDYYDRREGVAAFEEVALYQSRTRSMGEPGAIHRAYTMIVTPSFFPVLGIQAQLGRTFTDDEMEPGANAKAVIGHRLWQELFAGDPSALGRELRIEGVSHTVIGVMPEDFYFPGWDAQLWLPQSFTPWQKSDAARHRDNYDMIARLAPGATLAQARSQLDALNTALADKIPSDLRPLIADSGFKSHVGRFHDDLVREVKLWLYLLWGGALFVLLIGAVSITNLLLVRSTGRLRELATRYVLGAGRARLLRQLLTESGVLALVGGGLGILAGAWSLRLVEVFEAYQIPRVDRVALDPTAAILIVLVAVAVTAFSSAVAALAVRRRDLFSVLRSGSSTGHRGHMKLRGLLAAAQIAVACVLLVGAALMSASLANLLAIDLGFDTDRVLAGAVSLSGERYEEAEAKHLFFESILTQIRSLPGVTGAALASQLPFSGSNSGGPLTPEGYTREAGESLVSHLQTVISPDYFTVMGIALVAGRTFQDDDDMSSHPVVIVSREAANRYWGGVDAALGKKVFRGLEPDADSEWHTVVGVVGEAVHGDLTDPSRHGACYVPLRQTGLGFARLVVKTGSEPLARAPAVRGRIFAIDPEVALFWTTTLEATVASSLIPIRVPMHLLLLFAGIALLLAAVGVYGVLAQSVAQRTKEISIRMALGSSHDGIYRWALRSMFAFVVAGLVLGLIGALSLTHLMRGLLFGVRPNDPVVFLVVASVITAVAFLASVVPARRATRIDPVRVLASD